MKIHYSGEVEHVKGNPRRHPSQHNLNLSIEVAANIESPMPSRPGVSRLGAATERGEGRREERESEREREG